MLEGIQQRVVLPQILVSLQGLRIRPTRPLPLRVTLRHPQGTLIIKFTTHQLRTSNSTSTNNNDYKAVIFNQNWPAIKMFSSSQFINSSPAAPAWAPYLLWSVGRSREAPQRPQFLTQSQPVIGNINFYYRASMRNKITSSECTNLTRYFQIQRHRDIHQKRIKNVQPTLRPTRDFSNRSCGHIKKQPLAQFNRIVTIDIENRALLKKLTDKSPSRIGKEKPYKIVKNDRRKNLEDYKQRLENQGLLKRIREVKSSYQNRKFASDRKVTESYINTISKYGYKNFPPNKTIMVLFNKRNDSKFRKPETAPENSFEKRTPLGDNEECLQTQNKTDKIVSIESREWAHPDRSAAKITYIVWESKVSIQIDSEKEDSMWLQISKNTLDQIFDGKIERVHQSIKYSEASGYYIDLLEKEGKKY